MSRQSGDPRRDTIWLPAEPPEVKVKSFRKSQFKDLFAAVREALGFWVEILPVYEDDGTRMDGIHMLVDEDGTLHHKPFNPFASYFACHDVVGDAILVHYNAYNDTYHPIDSPHKLTYWEQRARQYEKIMAKYGGIIL